METRILSAALPAFLLACGTALAAEGKITILSPADGAEVSTKDKVAVTYQAVMGPDGDHLHLYLDDRRVDVLHQPKGTAEFRILMAGTHEICLTINTKWHFNTGVKQCIHVIAK